MKNNKSSTTLIVFCYDEEEDVSSDREFALEDISHIYWDANAEGCIVPRRDQPEDYSFDNANFFFDNTPDMFLAQHGFLQIHEKMFVPVRNIVSVRKVTGGSEIDIGDLHPVFTRRDMLHLLLEWRRELIRCFDPKSKADLRAIAKLDLLIDQSRDVSPSPEM